MSDLEDNLAVRGFVSVIDDDGMIDPELLKVYYEQKAKLDKEFWDYILQDDGPEAA